MIVTTIFRFAEAGLVEFRFVAASADIGCHPDAALWRRFIDTCPIIGLEARRP